MEMRNALLPLYDKYHVDLVLQGHDHTYARTHKLAAGKVVSPSQPGTIYAISVSGPKMYEIDRQFAPLRARTLAHTQAFQVIELDGDKLTYSAYEWRARKSIISNSSSTPTEQDYSNA